jgi:hypothetical protein
VCVCSRLLACICMDVRALVCSRVYLRLVSHMQTQHTFKRHSPSCAQPIHQLRRRLRYRSRSQQLLYSRDLRTRQHRRLRRHLAQRRAARALHALLALCGVRRHVGAVPRCAWRGGVGQVGGHACEGSGPEGGLLFEESEDVWHPCVAPGLARALGTCDCACKGSRDTHTHTQTQTHTHTMATHTHMGYTGWAAFVLLCQRRD